MSAANKSGNDTAATRWTLSYPRGLLEIVAIRPEPTQVERAAIVAAVEAFGAELWPHVSGATVPEPSPRWRYAGRPWHRRASYGGWA